MELERYRIYSEIARGIRKPFLVFKNANVFMAPVSSVREMWQSRMAS